MIWAFSAFLALSLLAAVILLAREAGRANALMQEEKEDLQGVIDAQKKTIEQDRIVSGNSNVSGMRERLSAALRRKRDS